MSGQVRRGSGGLLRRVDAAAIGGVRREPFDDATLATARGIVEEVRRGGWAAVMRAARRLGDLPPGAGEGGEEGGGGVVIGPEGLRGALGRVDAASRGVLERAAERIAAFARAQRVALPPMEAPVVGAGGAGLGRAGARWVAVERAGCYAPGGRFPLPSSVLMTAVTARAAGVREVWVASPRPTVETLAAAAIAGADGLLAVGGAQAVAALAYGAGRVPACDVIVGPGNRFVTAAKHVVSRHVGIDMLAGPSELLVIADETGDARLIAADLLAQAEHDPDAVPMLVVTDEGLAAAVEGELQRQLRDLPTAPMATQALRNGLVVVVRDVAAALEVSDRLAPEHLEIMTRDAESVARRARCFGAVFVGSRTAEVFGDYGAGPNHVLPTGGAARSASGLWVGTFLQCRTWLAVDDGGPAGADLVRDTAALARLEGLEGHARAAEARGR